MRKMLYSLAIAAIVAFALLVGPVSAANADSNAHGLVPPVQMSLSVTPACADLALARGTSPTCHDTANVITNADWKLEVADVRPDLGTILGMLPSYRGYMTKETGILNAPLTRITYPFILEVGANNDLRTGAVLVKGDGNAVPNTQAIAVPFRQQVSGSESAGDYSITLTYTLSPRA